MSTKDLTARWKSTAENDRASERIFNICKHGGVLAMDQTPFGRLESGLIDFRGYPARKVLVKDVAVKNVDLSYADFSNSWMEGNRFENCLFSKTDFSGATDHGDTFDRCVFRGCKFKLAIFGYDGSRFRDCIFEDCSIQRMSFIRPEFLNTDFVNCRLKKIEFNASSFENCKFEGLLEDVWFRGTFGYESYFKEFGEPKLNKMLNVSFEKADLRDITFSNGCDLSTVKIKDNGRYFKYDNWFQRLQFLSKEVASWNDKSRRDQAAKFIKVSMVHAPTQDWEILSLADWEEFFGDSEVVAKIVETLNDYSNHEKSKGLLFAF